MEIQGKPFSVTATHATAATATQAASSGKRHYITEISASSDKAGAIILVKQGTTTLWQIQVNAGNYNHTFKTPLVGGAGALVSVGIDGTSVCKANVAGITQ